jgi:hypothetical protein
MSSQWYQGYEETDFVHIGELHGDYKLLTSILTGAFQ